MFWHNLKYELLSGFRVKSFIFWLMIWPMVLGTLFKVAFGNVYNNEVKFESIPTAVVEESENQVFRQVIDSMEGSNEPLLDVTYTDKGNVVENSFMEYHIPTRLEVDKLWVEFEPSYENLGPFGAKSIGEVVINTPSPAIQEAVYQACGKRFYELPIKAEDIALSQTK